MQLRATLRQGLQTLLAHQVPSAQLAAELLLMHVLERDRAYLHAHADEEVPPKPSDRYSQLIAERTTGKPTQYITGHQEFWGLDFEVNAGRADSSAGDGAHRGMRAGTGAPAGPRQGRVACGLWMWVPGQDVSPWPWRQNSLARFCSAWIFRVPPWRWLRAMPRV